MITFTSSWQLILIFITTFTFLLALARSSTSKKSSKIPSPWRLPIVGNLHQLGPRPHQSLRKLSDRYGDVMLLHFGSVPMIIVSSAAAAQDVMKTHDLSFASRPSSQIAREILYDCVGITFSKYGDHWRRVRKIYTLNLLSQRRVQSFIPIINEEIALVMEKISASAGKEVVNLSELIVGLTSNITCRVAYGKKYEAEGGGGGRFLALFHELSQLLGAFAMKDFIPRLSWVDRLSGLDERVRKMKIEIDDILERVIEEHEKKREGGCGHEVEDFVDAMLSMKDDDKNDINIKITRETIKGLILEIFVGGTDTTYSSIEWIISELIKHPNAMKKVQEDIRGIIGISDTIDAKKIQDMKYLKAAIKETLRLHPPVPLLVPRECIEESQIQGYKVSAGAAIIINAWAIGKDPRSWEKPNEFSLERFLENDIDFKGTDLRYIPFGSGRRGCPGMDFGMAIVELALANLLCYFDWELGNGEGGEGLDMSESLGSIVSKELDLCLMAKKREVIKD